MPRQSTPPPAPVAPTSRTGRNGDARSAGEPAPRDDGRSGSATFITEEHRSTNRMSHLTVDLGGRPGLDCRGFCSYCYFK
ncbi:MAG: hypothetical protein PHP55_11950, partial [Methanoculleus sp.]|nr:hypothetical protein [Methanoculleus sp.]